MAAQEQKTFPCKIYADKKVYIKTFDPPKFAVGDPQALEYLHEQGYVVFKDVASPAETQTAHDLFWKYLSEVKPAIKRDDVTTWNDNNWPKWTQTGIIESDGIGQSEFLWFARGLPNVKKIFMDIWDGYDDLVVSFDAAGVFRPPEYSKDYITRSGWFHWDQNGYSKKGRQCVQGLLNILPAGPDDGGLVVIPRSTKLFDEMFENRKDVCREFGSDFVKVTTKDAFPEIWDNPANVPLKLNLNPGDFALWDSRTVHCNQPANPVKARMAPQLRRLVAYVCMTPAYKINNYKDYVPQRMAAFRDGLTSSHWPHDIQPRGRLCTATTRPVLTDNLKSLLVGQQSVAEFDAIYDSLK